MMSGALAAGCSEALREQAASHTDATVTTRVREAIIGRLYVFGGHAGTMLEPGWGRIPDQVRPLEVAPRPHVGIVEIDCAPRRRSVRFRHRACAYRAVPKIAFGNIAWTPLTPSTTCVTCRST